MLLPELVGACMLAAAVVYVLTGGADYGGGLWDLLASGPRKRAQRETIEHAIAPIWEVNHVWLILIVVLMFSGFPHAFAVITTALHIPLTLLLLGIVLRGSAFVFRAYGQHDIAGHARWGMVFSSASVVAPILLGVIAGSLGTEGITVEQRQVTSGFFVPWATHVFPWIVGLFTLTLFGYLAAVYLTLEATDPDLIDDFRRRALVSSVVAGVWAALTFVASMHDAPLLFRGLTTRPWSMLLFTVTVASAVTVFIALLRRRYRLARAAAIIQVAFIVLGWGAAQAPFLIANDVTVFNSAAPDNILRLLLIVLAVGAFPLSFLLYYLFRVFKNVRGDVSQKVTQRDHTA